MTDSREDKIQEPKRPVDTVWVENLKASIWRNEREGKIHYATTYARVQKDQDGKPYDVHSFKGGDQLKLAELARKSYERTNELRREDYQERRSTQQQQQERSR